MALRGIKEARADNVPKLIDFGTCALHTIDGAVRAVDKIGACVMKFSTSIYCVFKDTPSGETEPEFPMRFCQTRWVENVAAAERAINVIPHLQAYVKAVSSVLESSFVCGFVSIFWKIFK